MALFDAIHRDSPSLPVLILTAHGTIPEAVSATRRGVFSFLTKPFEPKVLLDTVAEAMRLSSPPPSGELESWRAELITRSSAMEDLLSQARRVAASDASVCIFGASGTGKELLARAIHRASPLAGMASRTRCCSAWAARACARKCSPACSAAIQGARTARARFHRSRRRCSRSRAASTSRARSSSSPASPAARSSRTLSCSTSSHRMAGAVGPARRRAAVSRHHRSGLEAAAAGQGRTASGMIALGDPAIGGRYSALSPFGLVPAAIMGLDVAALSTPRRRWSSACGAGAAARDNPGVWLGLRARRRRLRRAATSSPSSPRRHRRALGAWLEQLVAESTGKNGKAIVPVDLERPGAPIATATIALFVYLRLADRARCRRRMPAIAALRRPDSPSCASTWHARSPSARSFSAGRSPPRSRRAAAASTRSISPTSRPARSRRGRSPAPTSSEAACRRRRRP